MDKGATDKKTDKGAATKGSSDAKGSADQGAAGTKSSQSTTAEKDRVTTDQGAAAGSN